jgi:hypothetical protein
MMNNNNEIKIYAFLKDSEEAENYAKTLECMFTDVKSVPMFNDESVMLDAWGIEFFHKESQREIEWVIITTMMTYINCTGYRVSHVLENEDFKFYAEVQENLCLGEEIMLTKDPYGNKGLHLGDISFGADES